jgi:hypothetical protein
VLKDPGTILIILVVAALVFAIGGYQLVINKYYWGPKGPPNKRKAPGKSKDEI